MWLQMEDLFLELGFKVCTVGIDNVKGTIQREQNCTGNTFIGFFLEACMMFTCMCTMVKSVTGCG